MFAQKDVTKFLGIPVDGSKSEMRKKLEAKGYTYDSRNDVLMGEFNGRDVYVHIGTNNNKVWRIMISDRIPCGETDIRIRFNNLCDQFSRNKKYVAASLKDYTIPESEDISYESAINNKRYEAAYYQLPDSEVYDAASEEEKSKLIDNTEKKSVWFMINSRYGRYNIVMYYDNEYNHSDGEDL